MLMRMLPVWLNGNGPRPARLMACLGFWMPYNTIRRSFRLCGIYPNGPIWRACRKISENWKAFWTNTSVNYFSRKGQAMPADQKQKLNDLIARLVDSGEDKDELSFWQDYFDVMDEVGRQKLLENLEQEVNALEGQKKQKSVD